MKAVVMAGGEGTRLRPLTVNRPKPMVPIVGRPCMEHIVNLLKRHGIHEVIATLQFQPQVIQEYFGDGSEQGVQMSYSIEETPLGTAGSVRQIADQLADTFIVISGDALTDMDLSALIAFHKEQKAVATLALTRVPNPLEFGVVITDGAGRVRRFLEKPSWSEVFSDTINTGIYVLEPEIFSLMKEGQVYDFSKDIFPRLLTDRRPLYGFVPAGYWADIGSLGQFMRANYDCLEGKVRVDIPGEEVRRGVWIGRRAEIDPTASLSGPVFIGEGAAIRSGARLEPLSVISSGALVAENAQVSRSVVMAHAYLGPRTLVRGALIGVKTALKAGAVVEEGAVVGDGCQVNEGAQIKAEVKIWPGKLVEAGASVNTSLVWGARLSRSVFGSLGVSGLGNLELTPELALRLGGAFASTVNKGQWIAVSRDGHPTSVMLKRAMIAGLVSAGARVYNLENAPLPLTRHSIGALGAAAGCFIEIDPFAPGHSVIRFLDSRGVDIEASTERKIENLLAREDTRRVSSDEVPPVSYPSKIRDFYRTDFISRIDLAAIRRRQFRVLIDYGHGSAAQLMSGLVGELGLQEMSLNSAFDVRRLALAPEQVQAAQERLAQMVAGVKADLGILFDASGERLHLTDGTGHALTGMETLTLFCYLALEQPDRPSVAVPITASAAMEAAAGDPARVIRTRLGAKALQAAGFSHAVAFAGDHHGGCVFPAFQPGLDGIFASARLLELLALDGRSLAEVRRAMPQPRVAHETVECNWDAKGRVMRHLTEATSGEDVELLDGVKLRDGGRWAVALPDPVRPLFHLYVEPDDATDLLQRFRDLIEEGTRATD